MKARGLASFGWKVTSHRIKVACNRVRKLAGESASLIKKKGTRTCLDEMVNRIIDETGVTGFILESNTILTSMEREWKIDSRIVVLIKVYSKSYKEYFEFFFEYKVRKSPVETTSRYLRNTCNYLLKFVAFNEWKRSISKVLFVFFSFSPPVFPRSSMIDNPLYGTSFNRIMNFYRARLIFTLVQFLFRFKLNTNRIKIWYRGLDKTAKR